MMYIRSIMKFLIRAEHGNMSKSSKENSNKTQNERALRKRYTFPMILHFFFEKIHCV